MNNLEQKTKHTLELLPKIARNLQIAPLIDKVKPGLTTSQLMVLLILKDMKNVAMPIGKLAQELAVSFPSISGIIDRLHRDKLIERSRSRQDRRLVLVKLTDTGKELVEKLLKDFEKLLFNVLENISEAEQETIIKAIQRVFEFSIALSEDAHGKEVSLPETAT